MWADSLLSESPGKPKITGVGNLGLLHCRRILYQLTYQGSPIECFMLIMHVYVCEWLSCAWIFAIPWTAACQAPLSMGFSRQGYWNGLPCPPPGDHPDPRIEPRPPALQADCTIWAIVPSTYMIPVLTWNYDYHFAGDHTQISIALPLVSYYLWVRISLDLNLTVKLMKQNYVHFLWEVKDAITRFQKPKVKSR